MQKLVEIWREEKGEQGIAFRSVQAKPNVHGEVQNKITTFKMFLMYLLNLCILDKFILLSNFFYE